MPIAWDYAAALERVGGDEPLLAELIAIFFEEYPKFVGRITQSLAQQNFTALREVAHALKGSLAYLGARDAEAMAQEIEHACLTADLAKARELVANLVARIEDLRQLMISPTTTKEGYATCMRGSC